MKEWESYTVDLGVNMLAVDVECVVLEGSLIVDPAFSEVYIVVMFVDNSFSYYEDLLLLIKMLKKRMDTHGIRVDELAHRREEALRIDPHPQGCRCDRREDQPFARR